MTSPDLRTDSRTGSGSGCATLGQTVQKLEHMFRAAGLEGPRLDARLIATHVMDCPPETALISPEKPLSASDLDLIHAMAARRLKREPVAHLLGKREFWSIPFLVNEHTLIPRPDTETLVECVLSTLSEDRKNAPLSIVDVGTGSGCILIALLSELQNATGLGIDISQAALEVARKNADAVKMSDRAGFLRGDWFASVEQSFDIVVSNPPYIPTRDIASLDPGVSGYEPVRALDGGVDGLDAYRVLSASMGRVLNDTGLAAFEVSKGQAQDVATIFRTAGYGNIKTRPDLTGVDRVVLMTRSE